MTTSLSSVSGFTFQNYGPLTTTFTAPWSCANTARVIYGWVNDNGLDIFHGGRSQCTKSEYPECYPRATASVTATTSYNRSWDRWSGTEAYYSPGLYCPSGWATVGIATVNDEKDISTSGVLSYSTTIPYETFVYPPTLLAGLLEPSQTLVICCPSSMTADISGGCYSTIPDHQPTRGCNVWVSSHGEYGSTVMPYTQYNGEVTVGEVEFLTGTKTITTTDLLTYDGDFEDFVTAISYVSQVTLIHHESDFHPTATGTQVTGSISDSQLTASTVTQTTTATSTANLARRLTRTSSKWDGIIAVFSVCTVGMTLGSVMIFSF